MNVTTDRLYTPRFFLMFAATVLFMTGVALLFHFGQYIEYLGHGVDTLGMILSLAIVGKLMIRLQLGRWIDRFGCKPLWLIGSIAVSLSVGAMQWAESVWLITVLRAVAVIAVAAVMTTLAVFAAQIAPPRRRAESLGTMGLGGFIGMVLGTSMGDYVFSGATDTIGPYRLFFSLSAACCLLAGLMVIPLHMSSAAEKTEAERPTDMSRPYPQGKRRSEPSQIRVIMTHWPGAVLLVGVVFHMAFCLQNSFLERLAEQRGFKDIKIFFLVYAPTAMVLRIVGRRIPELLGRSRTLLGGLLLLSIGLCCMVGVDSQWALVLPGLLMGAGHCFIFPSMVDLAAERLPPEHRGTGTSLILGAGDVGLLIGYASLGSVIATWGFDIALVALAGTVLFGAVVFAVSQRRAIFRPRRIDAAAAVESDDALPAGSVTDRRSVCRAT